VRHTAGSATLADMQTHDSTEAVRRTARTTSTSSTLHLFLARGLAAIVWAVAFASVADSLTTGVTSGQGSCSSSIP
jgi:hypothetical protein